MNKKNPIVLVPGFLDNASRMQTIENYLKCRGRNVCSVTLKPSNGKIGIDILAQQLDNIISKSFDSNTKIDLIGFSMGGLICRYYIQRLNGIDQVDHFITISTPHNGTMTAFLLNNVGAKQMRYQSKFIKDLNSDIGKLNRIKFTSIWTPLDLMIIPATSSILESFKVKRVICLFHQLMVRNKSCLQIIGEELLK